MSVSDPVRSTVVTVSLGCSDSHAQPMRDVATPSSIVEDGDLVGIVALDDVFALLAVEQDRFATVVEAESPVFE